MIFQPKLGIRLKKLIFTNTIKVKDNVNIETTKFLHFFFKKANSTKFLIPDAAWQCKIV
jgi:hypothetical protein